MTVDQSSHKPPTLHPNGKVSGKTYLTTARKRFLYREIAAGERSLKWLADRYDISYDYCRQLASENSDEIAKIAAELGPELTKHAFTDKLERIKELCLDIEEISEQMKLIRREDADIEMSAPEHWQRLAMAKRAFIRDLNELLGELPTRAAPLPADQGKYAYELVGVDMNKVIEHWQQGPEGSK